MKIKQNVILLTITGVFFALTSALMIHAAEDNDSMPYGLSKQKEKPYGLIKSKKGEAGNLFFQNGTPYTVKVYANVRNGKEIEYGSTSTYLGEIPATGASTNFSIPKGDFIGRRDTKYWLEIMDGASTLVKKEFTFKLKNKNDSYSEDFEVKKADGSVVKLSLKVEYDRKSGIDMTLSLDKK